MKSNHLPTLQTARTGWRHCTEVLQSLKMPVTNCIITQNTHPCMSEHSRCLLVILKMKPYAELHTTDMYMQDKAHTIQMSPKVRAMWYISLILCRVGLAKLLFLLWPAALFRNVLPLTLSLLSSLFWDAHHLDSTLEVPWHQQMLLLHKFINILNALVFQHSAHPTPSLSATYKFKV